MYIARLHLRGFKSFGGSHDLTLAPGFVAVVGPNGSGKSNLLDALRWTLGDSHPGRLRIVRQSDLLFQGSPSLPGAKEAEVSLQLREDLRVCTLRRRVLADGSTQALVDGERRTLQELEETKRQFRLEGDRFAFIGQGEVAEVIQQRPGARRLQLETLFGIDVYRKRRTDASDRLARGQEEFQRLRAFSAELSSRREEIAPEVERAGRARILLDELEELRRRYYWARRGHLEEALERIARDQEDLVAQGERRAFWRRVWGVRLAYLEGAWRQADASREEEARQREDLRRFFDEQGRRAFALGTALAEGVRGEEARQREARSLDEEIRRQGEEAEGHRRTCEALEREWNQAREEEQERERRHREARERDLARARRREDLLRRRGTLEAERTSSGAYLRSLGQQWLRGREEASEIEGLLREAREGEVRAREAREAASEGAEAAASRHGETYARCQETAGELQRLRREAASLRSRLDEWTETLELQVLPRPVQHVLSAARLGKVDARPVAVLDAFRCPSDCAEAVEAFLGGRQFWLLVKTLEESGRCIDLLKGHQAGRATFLPLDRTRPRSPDRRGAASATGVVGFALDLVEVTDPQWRPALEHLLGDLLVVRTFRDGQTLARSPFRGPVVTLEGDVFQPTGAVSGGRQASRHRALEIKGQMDQAQARLGETERRLSDLGEELQGREEAERGAGVQREGALRSLQEAQSLLQEAQRTLGDLESRREGADRAREELRRLLEAEGRKRLEVQTEVRSLQSALPEEGEEDLTSLEAAWERSRAQARLLEERLRGALSLKERMEEERRRLTGRREEIQGFLESRETRRAAALEELAVLGRRWLEAHGRRRDLQRQEEEGVRLRSSLEVRLESVRRHHGLAEAAAQRLDQLRAQGVQERTALEREREDLVSTWEDQYPYPGGSEGDPQDPQDPEDLRRRIRERDRVLKDLGPVDPGVLSEDRSLKDRLAFLGEQMDDVRGGMGELEKLIAEADRQAQTVFSKALGEIDRRFDHLFQRLFGGGEAHLVLLEAATPWEAGVEVVARPPGKRPQSISQLSGGEQSLSAIALLFASREVAGCPLAVLDEVDAALDEVNLRRFADLAREYAQSRQILAMTHRRVTMERADLLYGVTLSEPGLSQVVGVRLEDWS